MPTHRRRPLLPSLRAAADTRIANSDLGKALNKLKDIAETATKEVLQNIKPVSSGGRSTNQTSNTQYTSNACTDHSTYRHAHAPHLSLPLCLLTAHANAHHTLNQMLERLSACYEGSSTPVDAALRCTSAALGEFRQCRNTKDEAIAEFKAKFDGLAVAGRVIGEVQAVTFGLAAVAAAPTGGNSLVAWVQNELTSQISEMRQNAVKDTAAQCQLLALTSNYLTGFAQDIASMRVRRVIAANQSVSSERESCCCPPTGLSAAACCMPARPP